MDGVDAAGFLIEVDLAIRAGTTGVIHQVAHIGEVGAGAEVTGDIVYHIQKLVDGIAYTERTSLPKVDNAGVKPVAHGAPLVFFEEIARHNRNLYTVSMQPGQLRDERLAERGDANHIVEGGGHIENAKFDCAKKRMGSDIPPDFFGIIDTAGINECAYIVVELAPGLEGIW